MSDNTRRCFLRRGLTAMAAAAVPSPSRRQPESPPQRFRKAVKYHMLTENLSAVDKLKLLRDLGFEGVEPRARLEPDQAEAVRELARAREVTDFPVHGVTNSSHPDIVAAIDQAQQLGATSVLQVVRANPRISYWQNYRETQDVIRRAVDHAEAHEILILIENVWASYLIDPVLMARFIDELDSPWVQAYFDVGNVLRWGWPQHWIEVLGSRIRKLDIKEFDLNVAQNQGLRQGFQTPLGEGSIDWPRVREELRKADFNGWATAEMPGGDRTRLADISARMDRVLDLGEPAATEC